MDHFSSHNFADADSPYNEAYYVIFGVPYDGTTSYRSGTRDGPRAIRDITYNFETYNAGIGIDLKDIPITDLGDIEPFSLPQDVVLQVEDAVRHVVRDGKIPIMLGGEHSLTLGAVRVLHPDCYVVCDAHLDLRSEYGGTPFNHACVSRRVHEEGIHDIFIIGARSGTEEEYEFARNIHLYSADDVRNLGISTVLDEILNKIGRKRIYLSIDADVIDCCLTPGVGTPEPFGLHPLDVREIVRRIGPHAIGFDYVEVCPADSGQTAAVAARLIREFIAVHWNQRV